MKNKIAVLLTIALSISAFGSNVLALSTENTNLVDINKSSVEITGDYKEGEALVLYKQSSLSASSLEYKLAEGIDIVDTFDFEKENPRGFEASALSMYEQSTLVSVVKSDQYTTAEIIDILDDKSNVLIVEPNYAIYPMDIVASELAIATDSTETTTEATTAEPSLIQVGKIENSNPPASDYNNMLWGFEDDKMAINEVRAENSDKPLAENVVAVVDSGVDYTHEDLVDSMWHNPLPRDILPGEYGYDCNDIDDDPFPLANDEHGTHVAGTIAAQNNGQGIDGISPNTKIMALKIFGEGECYADNELRAFRYILKAVDNGINVVAINNSWGGESNSQIFKYCIDQFYERGIISVAAAGNETANNDKIHYCLSNINSEGTIIVNATNIENNKAFYSNYGKNTTHVWAPGSNIISTILEPHYNNYVREDATKYIDFEDNTQQFIKIIDGVDYGLGVDKMLYEGSQALKVENVTKGKYTTLLLPIGKKKDLPQNTAVALELASDFKGEEGGRLTLGFTTLNVSLNEALNNNITAENFKDSCTLYNDAIYIGNGIYSIGTSDYADISALKDEEEIYLTIKMYLLSDCTRDGTIYIDNISVGDMAEAQRFGESMGTSMACPNITGAIAYMRSLYPEMSVGEVKARTVGGCIKTEAFIDTSIGEGYFNLKKALNNPNPYISGVTYGDNKMTIQGYFFGDTNNSVTLAGQPMEVLSWSDKTIVVSLTEFSSNTKDLVVTGTNGTGRRAVRTSDANAISLEHIADFNAVDIESYSSLECESYMYGDYLYRFTNYIKTFPTRTDIVLIKKNMKDLSEAEEIITLSDEEYTVQQATMVGEDIYISCVDKLEKNHIFRYSINSNEVTQIANTDFDLLYTDGEDLFAIMNNESLDMPFYKYNLNTNEWKKLDIPKYSDEATIEYAEVINDELIIVALENDQTDATNTIRVCKYKNGSWSAGEPKSIESVKAVLPSSFKIVDNLVYMVGMVSNELGSIAGYNIETEQWADLGYKLVDYPFTSSVSMFTYNNALRIITHNAQTDKYGIYKLPNSDEVKGDVDGDGNISATDSSLILQHILNPEAVGFSASQINMADVNGDGNVNAEDSAMVLQKALNSTFVF